MLREQKQQKQKVQSSLHSLKGVVVVEDLVRAKKLLKEEDVEEERKVRVLRELGEKRPSTELLESTGIGRTVRKLSEEGEGEVKREATKVYRSWRDTVEKRVELSHTKIEVRCDKVSIFYFQISIKPGVLLCFYVGERVMLCRAYLF